MNLRTKVSGQDQRTSTRPNPTVVPTVSVPTDRLVGKPNGREASNSGSHRQCTPPTAWSANPTAVKHPTAVPTWFPPPVYPTDRLVGKPNSREAPNSGSHRQCTPPTAWSANPTAVKHPTVVPTVSVPTDRLVGKPNGREASNSGSHRQLYPTDRLVGKPNSREAPNSGSHRQCTPPTAWSANPTAVKHPTVVPTVSVPTDRLVGKPNGREASNSGSHRQCTPPTAWSANPTAVKHPTVVPTVSVPYRPPVNLTGHLVGKPNDSEASDGGPHRRSIPPAATVGQAYRQTRAFDDEINSSA
nr:extensin-like [Aedes albopictus]